MKMVRQKIWQPKHVTKESSGRPLDKWSLATRDEEQVIIQQFLRFGETKSIAQEIILQDTRENRERGHMSAPRTESEIKKFIERSSLNLPSFVRGFDARHLIARSMAPTTPPSSLIPPATTSCNTRVLSPSAPLPTYTPSVTPPPRGPSSHPDSPDRMPTASPVGANSPLSRLQGMQPFDYRREHLSPAASPGSGSEKSLNLSSSGNKTPEDLSLGGTSSVPSPPSSSSNPLALTTHINPVPHIITPTKADSSDELSSYTSGHLSDDDQEGVIDYSTKDMNSSLYADRKVKHLRKSSNPMKRHWQPNPQFGSTLISPSGKKRVLCTACNKTFCDKGALKIHYSAVHLKEMHKCSVEGCNMMFSSRRSRNRHSANPNPKLHMPNQKRKLPDGVTVVDDQYNPLSTSATISPNPSITMAGTSNILSSMPSEIKTIPQKPMAPLVGHERTPLMTAEMGFYMDPTTRMPLLIPSPIKMTKLDMGPVVTSAPATHMIPMPGFYATPPHPIKIEPIPLGHRSSRKRKSAVPTRCAQLEETEILSEDESGNLVTEAATEENLMPQNLTVPKRKNLVDEPSDGLEDANTINHDNDGNPSKVCTSGQCDSDNENTDSTEEIIQRSKMYEGLSLTAFHDIQVKAMRQMDCISQARIRAMCNDDSKDDNEMNNHEGDDEMEEDFPHNNGNRSPSPENGYTSPSMISDFRKNGSAPSSPATPENGLDLSNSSNEGSPRPTNGHIGHDAYLSEMAVDGENPKMCAACGKLFPNPFALKAHYENIHLKLMHTCSVDGCNAAFPSKRSRDRHSSNLNLHRKLLSTSSTDADEKMVSRDEFMSRLYDGFSGPNSYGGGPDHVNDEDDDCNDLVVNMSTKTDANMNKAINEGFTPTPQNLVNGDSPSHIEACDDMAGNESQDEATPNKDGSVTCHICRQLFRDNLVLKEHYEKTHPKEMFKCSISGCDKIFSTRKSRNRHSQNDNLHRHLSPNKTITA